MSTFYVTKETTETRKIEADSDVDAISRFMLGEFSGEPEHTTLSIGAAPSVTED